MSTIVVVSIERGCVINSTEHSNVLTDNHHITVQELRKRFPRGMQQAFVSRRHVKNVTKRFEKVQIVEFADDMIQMSQTPLLKKFKTETFCTRHVKMSQTPYNS